MRTEDVDDAALKETPERVAESTRSSQSPRTPNRASRSSTMVTPTKISTRNASRTTTTLNSSKQSSSNKLQYEKTYEALATVSESTSEEPLVQEKISKLSPEKHREERKDMASNVIQNEIHVQMSSERSWGGEAKRINIFEGDGHDANVSQVPATEPSEKSSTIEHVDQFSRTREEHEAKEGSIHKVSKVQQPLPRVSIDKTKDVTKLQEKTEIQEDADVDETQNDNFEKDIEDKSLVEKKNIKRVEDTYNIKDNVDIPMIEQPTHMTSDQIDRTYNIEFKDKAKTINDYCVTQENEMDISDSMKNMDEKMYNISDSQNVQVLTYLLKQCTYRDE